MRSHILVLAVAGLSVPLALVELSGQAAKASGLEATQLAPPVQWQLAQAAPRDVGNTGFSNTVHGHQLESAPVPYSLGGGVAPADRVATPDTVANGAGPVNATPFSGAPNAQRSTNDPTASRSPTDDTVTPNLGR